VKKASLFINLYAILLIIGGISGYVAAHSLVSLFSSAAAALILVICTFWIKSESIPAYYTAMGVVTFLFLFFSYRYFLSFKFVPAGNMAIISALLLVYLIIIKLSADKKAIN